MTIVEYNNSFDEQLKDLLVELQEHIVSIDKFNLNIISKNYREEYFRKTINEVTDNQGTIFVAIENKTAIGMIACFIEKYNETDKLDYACPKKGIISELVVSKNNRGSGTGKLLISAAEKYLKNKGCEFVQLELFAYNETAKAFYEKQNYQERCVTLFKKLK